MSKERNQQNDDNDNKKPRKFQALINRWNGGSEEKQNEQGSSDEEVYEVDISGEEEEEDSPKKSKKLLTQWKDCKHGSGSFEIANRNQRDSSNKTSMKIENEKSIKNYKANNLKQNKFNGRKVPTRGMSARTKPVNLKNIFAAKDSDEIVMERNNILYSSDSGGGSSSLFFVKNSLDADVIRKAIKNNLFFDLMTTKELDQFIGAFEPIKVDEGLDVVTQGHPGDFFYIIGKNSGVTFHINGIQVGEAGEGESFGELALLYSSPRAATAVAMSSPTNLFRVGRRTFRTLLQEQTKRNEKQKIDLLKAVDFLSAISEFDLNRLARAMTLNVFHERDSIFKKGDEGDAFYIVHEGQLQVTDISVGSARFDNFVLKSGDYFGERALVTHEPRAANVIAATNGSTFRIDRTTFERVLGKFSRVIMKSQDRKILVRF
jgi:cAMP-dependent protein kinase regulator